MKTQKLSIPVVLILALVAARSVLTPSALAQTIDCSIADSSIQVASKIRGLEVKKPVPCKLQNKKEVEEYLKETIRTKIPKKKLEAEERIYKLLGIIPEDYQYQTGLVDLYTSQLGGYYDPDKDYYAMAAWMPASMQLPIAVHELIHALQDQHFTIDKLLDPKTVTSDALMARSAVLEGDATAVMLDYSMGLQGMPPLSEQESVSAFLLQNISGALLSSAAAKAPRSLYAMMIFPYVSGLNFVHTQLKKEGYKSVDKLFSRLPQTTEEILHPEIYESGKSSYSEVEVEEFTKGVPGLSKSPMMIDVLGEFFISTMLSSLISPYTASEAAAGWAGDKLALYSIDGTSRDFMVWASNWDTADDAKEFYDALSDAFKKRFTEKALETPKKLSFTTKSFGSVEIELRSPKVVLTMGG